MPPASGRCPLRASDRRGKHYLCAIKHACSKRIVGHLIDSRMTSALGSTRCATPSRCAVTSTQSSTPKEAVRADAADEDTLLRQVAVSSPVTAAAPASPLTGRQAAEGTQEVYKVQLLERQVAVSLSIGEADRPLSAEVIWCSVKQITEGQREPGTRARESTIARAWGGVAGSDARSDASAGERRESLEILSGLLPHARNESVTPGC